jgi:hypothetical protein
VGYLFGIAHNKTQRVKEDENKNWVRERDHTSRVVVLLSTAWHCLTSCGWFAKSVHAAPGRCDNITEDGKISDGTGSALARVKTDVLRGP